jgi:hypothetical protein
MFIVDPFEDNANALCYHLSTPHTHCMLLGKGMVLPFSNYAVLGAAIPARAVMLPVFFGPL